MCVYIRKASEEESGWNFGRSEVIQVLAYLRWVSVKGGSQDQ
jgi:hypothetical protein